MTPLAPEQALFLLHFMLPTIENEHRHTRKVLRAIPADKAGYQPDPASKSAFDLAWHLAASENRFLGGIAAGEFDFGPIDKPATLAEIADWYDATSAKNISALKELSGEQAARIMDFRGMFQQPAAAFLTLSMNHSIHHRGQLTTYLRPMGAKVPSIYGESYDDSEARKAAAAAQN